MMPHQHRRLAFFATVVALTSVRGFPWSLPAAARDRIGSRVPRARRSSGDIGARDAPTITLLHLKVERYNIEISDKDESGSDDDKVLFNTLISEKTASSKVDYDADNIVLLHESVKAPTSSLAPDDIVPLIMYALKNNDTPKKDAGLSLVWEFASDTTQYIFSNNITEFIESCHETANEFPTSFYGAAMNGKSWALETPINRVGGEDGWIATQVMKTICSDGRLRRWQWEVRKNKRPPCLGCWKVEQIGSSDRNGDFEARDRGDGWSD